MLMSGDPTLLDSYITFFEGFFISLKMVNGIDAERELSAWFQDRVEIKAPNMYWFAQLKQVERAKTEREQIDSLLDYLEQFLNPNRQGMD